ncbi:unnamed protein product [Lota lota]
MLLSGKPSVRPDTTMDQGPPHRPEDGGAGTAVNNSVTPVRPAAGGGAAAWLVKKARLAVAMAVIKSRPPGLSGREHAETLASRLRSRDDGWRSRAQELQEEVLHLRQRLLLAKMAAQIRDVGKASGDDFFLSDGVLSQDLPGPAEEEGLMMDCDSGCGTETLLPHVDPANPAAPGAPHTDPVNPAAPGAPHTDPVNPAAPGAPHTDPGHMQFLQSLCGLRRAGDRGGRGGAPGPAWFGPQQEDPSVMGDSLRQLLGSVVAAVCSADPPPLPSGDLVLEACQVLAGATDAWCLHRQPSPQFVADVDVSLKELVGQLFHGDRLGKVSHAGERVLTEYLILLGESRLLRPLLVRHLLSLVHGLAERLCHLCQVEEHSEPEDDVLHLYENSFHLFWVLEKLLQQRVEVEGAGVTQDHEASLGPQDHQASLGVHDHQASLGPHDHQASLGVHDHQASLGLLDQQASLRPLDHQASLGLLDHQASLGLLDQEAPLRPQDLEASVGVQDLEASVGVQEREAFLGLLGRSVLLLSDEFPLFALYMWRVGALISW